MTIAAFLIPPSAMSEMDIERVVRCAVVEGLVPCNAMRGPFRIFFFQRDRAPKGWSRIGVAIKESPCA